MSITTDDHCLMIEATAGSGKTTLMVQRLSDLVLSKNIPPDQCLAITFTEKAAKEMKDRLLDVFKANEKVSFPMELVSKMTICTIHSFCQNVLSKHALNIDVSPNFQIIEGLEKMNRLDQLLSDFYESYRFNPPEWLSKCLSIWSNDQFGQLLTKAYTNRDKIMFWAGQNYHSIDLKIIEKMGRNHDDYLEICDAFYKAATAFFTCIDNEKKENDWLDYDDILNKCYQLLANTDWLRNQYQEQFRYVFVDEFQDTSLIQWQIVRQLCSESDPFETNKLWLVGDRCQAIYGFRGADDSLMQMITETKHSNLKHQKNTNNYRSHPIIINFINQLFHRLFDDQNETFLPMVPQRHDGDSASIDCIIHETANDELQTILSYINKAKKNGVAMANIAILVRKNLDIKVIKTHLDQHHIPCQVSKGAGLCELDIVQVIICFLIGLLNPYDSVAWVSIVKDILGDQELLSFLHRNEPELFQKSVKNNHHVMSWKNQLESGEMVTKMIHLVWKLPLKWSDNDKGAIQVFLSKFEALWASVDGNKQMILDWLYACIKSPKAMSMETESDPSAVQIMTLHAAKGLEFPMVIVPFLDAQFNVGASDPLIISNELGIALSIPKLSKNNLVRKHIYEVEKKQAICEEIRLFYVTLTRAKQHLLLTGKQLKRKNSSRLSLCLPYMDETTGHVSFKFSGPTKINRVLKTAQSKDEIDVGHKLVKYAPNNTEKKLSSWSISNLLDALECPKKMMLKKFRSLEFIESSAQKEGLSMHALLANALLTKEKDPMLFDPDWLQRLKSSDWFQRMISTGRLLIEEPFEYQYKDHIFRGRFDAVWFCDKTNTFQLFEFKRSIGFNEHRYQRQVNIYARVVSDRNPSYSFDFNQSAIINIQSAEFLPIKTQKFCFDSIINAISENKFKTNSESCLNCPYDSMISNCHQTTLNISKPTD
tara:strand:+ start:1521 stop:4325 length:2805 start_codon:yes stop_codon:yes gene_type:complete